MKILNTIGFLVFITACSDRGSDVAEESASDKPPMFVVSKDATGPLSLVELQVHLPDEIDRKLNDSSRSCFFSNVERLANEAGDPANLDPNAFPYWDGKVDQKQWQQHSKYMQRVLLAQAVISWAIMDC